MGKILYKVTLTEDERADLLCITKKVNNRHKRLFMH